MQTIEEYYDELNEIRAQERGFQRHFEYSPAHNIKSIVDDPMALNEAKKTLDKWMNKVALLLKKYNVPNETIGLIAWGIAKDENPLVERFAIKTR